MTTVGEDHRASKLERQLVGVANSKTIVQCRPRMASPMMDDGSLCSGVARTRTKRCPVPEIDFVKSIARWG